MAPCLTICGTISPGLPAATIRMSAEDGVLGEVAVLAWQIVTVASRCSSISAMGLPTMLLAPTTTTFLPVTSVPRRIEQQLNAIRRAGREDGVAHHQPAHVVEVEAVYVFIDRDRLQHPARVDVSQERQLDEDAMHGRVGIQAGDGGEHFRFRRVGGEADVERAHAHLLAGLHLIADIDAARRVVADEDHRQTGLHALGLCCATRVLKPSRRVSTAPCRR